MTGPEPIKIEGLREFRRNLRNLDSNLPKGLRLAGNAAAKIVVDTAKPRVPVGPGQGGHASSSIKVASTATAARVSAGGKRYPYFPWLDFGGRVGPKKKSLRPFLKKGRYIWSAYDDERDQIEQTLLTELTDIARSAGMEVT